MSENREISEVRLDFVDTGKMTRGRQKTSKQIEMEAQLLAELSPKEEPVPPSSATPEPDAPEALREDAAREESAPENVIAPQDAASEANSPQDAAPEAEASPQDASSGMEDAPSGNFIHDNVIAVNGIPMTKEGGAQEALPPAEDPSEKALVRDSRCTIIVGRIVERVKASIPEGSRNFLSRMGRKLSAPLSIFLLVVMLSAIGLFVRNQYLAAVRILDTGPEKAYALESEGNHEAAKQLWIQVNAKMFWYQPLSGFLTSIDQPYLQKASVAYKAGDWKAVAENAYKALQVPISDQQAVYVQQMIMQATANMIKVYLPNQAEQPIRGGVPDHAQPVCEPSATYIWVIPAILILLAGAFLYSRKKFMFATMAILMPCYFWALNVSNAHAIKTCEARLDFNPEHITLYGEPKVPLPAFTPTPLRVESVPMRGAARTAPETAVKSDFVPPSEPLRIESGNAPVRK